MVAHPMRRGTLLRLRTRRRHGTTVIASPPKAHEAIPWELAPRIGSTSVEGNVTLSPSIRSGQALSKGDVASSNVKGYAVNSCPTVSLADCVVVAPLAPLLAMTPPTFCHCEPAEGELRQT
ncbi:MAG: hypothetical protein ACP5JH_05280 [Bacteroidota bacterium]